MFDDDNAIVAGAEALRRMMIRGEGGKAEWAEAFRRAYALELRARPAHPSQMTLEASTLGDASAIVSASAPSTSQAAARSVAALTGEVRLRVLRAIEAHGGLTDDEGCEVLAMNPSTYRPRRHELVRGYKRIEGGWVQESGRRRPTASGLPAIVWVATDKGIAELRSRGR
jgi:hypothetical protein